MYFIFLAYLTGFVYVSYYYLCNPIFRAKLDFVLDNTGEEDFSKYPLFVFITLFVCWPTLLESIHD